MLDLASIDVHRHAPSPKKVAALFLSAQLAKHRAQAVAHVQIGAERRDPFEFRHHPWNKRRGVAGFTQGRSRFARKSSSSWCCAFKMLRA
jgi:hypothetical protein